MHEKQELKEMQQLDKNEEYEYSHEKAKRVSLPHKNARIQPSLLQKIKANKKQIDAPSKVHKMWTNKNIVSLEMTW